MIKPIDDASKITPIKKRTSVAKTEGLVDKSRIEDNVTLSTEALAALKIDQLVQKAKELPAVREERIMQSKQRLQEADYLETAMGRLAEDLSSLIFSGAKHI